MAIGQKAFQPHTLPAVALKQEPSRRPDPVEAVELGRVLLCVSFDGKEILADEFGSFLFFIRLGIQPSTGSSPRSRVEIQKDGAKLVLRCAARV